ncbi:MlaD family protein [Nibricoccus sp. IMCC34717]|uniref:MlaD family protein n=1 Tax=Nibricoccus sp. IMCC34717 TaxID=3034021 RepID=UPI00384ADE10
MNQTQMTARVGLFFLIGVALIWVTWEALHNGKLSPEKGYKVVTSFATLKELKPGDPVRMAGVQIGNVQETRLNKGRAEAVLVIENQYPIAKDSIASIAMAGLIGANYITVDPGNPEVAGVVTAGGTVKTAESADLQTIINDLSGLGKELRGTLAQISGSASATDGQGGLFQKLDRLVTENSTKVSTTLSNLEAITNKIRQGEGTLGKLVNDPEAYNRLLATVDEIKYAATDARQFLASGQEIVAHVKSGKGAVGTLLYDEQAAENLRYTLTNLREVSGKLNNPNSTFGQLIGNDQLMREVQGTLKKADRALEGLSDQGPISAVGAVAQGLF